MRQQLGLAFVSVVCTWLGVVPAQNSTAKERRVPGALAARAGTRVPWRVDLEAALAEAAREQKPVFWYVPAVEGSPMDRKEEIDRYLMGGPFSWPSTIELLATHFVPVKQIAAGERARQLGLVQNRFVEPGYVVLAGDGTLRLRVDQITTLHPQWFEAPLRRLARQPIERWPCAPGLDEAWAKLRAGDYEQVHAAIRVVSPFSQDVLAEMTWIDSVASFCTGERARAEQQWRYLAEHHRDHPLAAKAALELEGHGPFGRGFEVYSELPAAVLAADPHDGSRAPAGAYTEPALWQRSVAFLLTHADDDGVYRDSTYDFGGTDSLPNVHAAVTCLVGEALLAAAERLEEQQFELTAPLATRLEQLLLQIRSQALAADWLSLSDRDEILWARAYALRFLLAWQLRRPADAESLAPGVRSALSALLALQPATGAWFHEYANPFATATALQALWSARANGFEVPQANVDQGLRALLVNRTEAGAFTYGQTRPGAKPRATVEAAAGRMPLCELALFRFGQADEARLIAALEAAQRHHGLLAAVRKYDDHADAHGYGGFFFWFDMLGRAEAVAAVGDAERRRELASAVHELVLQLPEFDGCFVDSHELGRAYGTAMALLCLDALAVARR